MILYEYTIVYAIYVLFGLSVYSFLATNKSIRRWAIPGIILSGIIALFPTLNIVILPVILFGFVYRKEKTAALMMLIPLWIYGVGLVFDLYGPLLYNFLVIVFVLHAVFQLLIDPVFYRDYKEMVLPGFLAVFAVLWGFFYIPECILTVCGYLAYLSIRYFRESIIHKALIYISIIITQIALSLKTNLKESR